MSSDVANKKVVAVVTDMPSLSLFKANAEEMGGGKLIEFTVNNLDGDEESTGSFVVKTRPDWAPLGAEQSEELVESSFFDGCRAFRVLPEFIVQFGINGGPDVQAKWHSQATMVFAIPQVKILAQSNFSPISLIVISFWIIRGSALPPRLFLLWTSWTGSTLDMARGLLLAKVQIRV